MLLIIYVIIATFSTAIVFYKCNKKHYATYVIIAIIGAMSGFLSEEANISAGEWLWNQSFMFILHIPLEIIIVYALLFSMIAIISLFLKDIFKADEKLSYGNASKWCVYFGLSMLLLIPFYGILEILSIMTLFFGLAFFFKYRNRAIIYCGVFASVIDIIFDTLLIYTNILPQYYKLPYFEFFALGLVFSGITFYLDGFLYRKK